jgi:Protein of unknown function VcgC/VcgE (DUF2780)
MKTFATMATIVAATLSGCASIPQNAVQTGGASLPAGTMSSQLPAVVTPSVGTVAGQLPSVGAATSMVGSVAGAVPAATQTPSLVGILVQQLGITPQQATGGAGSIFSMAQQSMNPSSFGQVSQAVPGMSQLLSAAPALGGGGSLGNMVALASTFQSLGMNSSMMGQFIPVILQYVQGQGGNATMSLLQSALMP